MSFEPKTMERGRGQVLYRFRPGQTFDHVGGFEAQVLQLYPDEAYDGPRLDPDYLIDEAMRFVQRWRREGMGAPDTEPTMDAAPEFPEEVPLAREQYEVFVPGRVFCRVWPRMLRCGDPKCGYVWESPDPAPGDDWPGACPRCKHRRDNRQLQYVFVHACGEIAPMTPPRECAQCQRKAFRLDDRGSRFIDFLWECLHCHGKEAVHRFCGNPRCRWKAKGMSPQVHTASSAYNGQGMTLVNVPLQKFSALRTSPRFIVASIAHWLNQLSTEDLKRLLADETGPSVPPEVLAAIESLAAAGLEEQAAALRRRFLPVNFTQLRRTVMDTLGFDPLDEANEVKARQLAANLEIYRRVLTLPQLAIRDVEREAASPARLALYASYRDILRSAGLDADRVALITSFPVTRVAVGYTRNGFSPQEADLVAYKGRVGKGQAEKTLLPVYPTETEALLFTLDPALVAEWVRRNGWATDTELRREDGGVLRWFARGLEGYDGQLPPWGPGRAEPGSAIEGPRALFTLLHSMAHQVLRALAVDSGFQETGLSEYLFPYALAFAIYPNAGGEFTIGGLRTVLEQSLADVVGRAFDNASCLYDPNCLVANRGADHGCLFLPETACQMWNRDLSRWELFGGSDLDGGRPVHGFWETTR